MGVVHSQPLNGPLVLDLLSEHERRYLIEALSRYLILAEAPLFRLLTRPSIAPREQHPAELIVPESRKHPRKALRRKELLDIPLRGIEPELSQKLYQLFLADNAVFLQKLERVLRIEAGHLGQLKPRQLDVLFGVGDSLDQLGERPGV